MGHRAAAGRIWVTAGVVAAGAALLLGAWGCAGSRPDPVEAADDSERAPGLRVVQLPMADFTGGSLADSLLAPVLRQGLENAGAVVVTGSELRPLLRRHRIRSRGMIGAADARIIAEGLQADLLLLGSWDVARAGENPEMGLSLRILDPRTMRLVRSVSANRTAVQDEGWLGTGRGVGPAAVAREAVAEALANLGGLTDARSGAGDVAAGPLVGLIPLDNLSATRQAGDVVSAVLLTALMDAGLEVCEPGFIREYMLEAETAFRGRIDRPHLRALHERQGIRYVVTGTVDVLEQGAGDPLTSVPRVAMGLRMLDAENGALLFAREYEGAGDDHDGWFRQGRRHGMTALARFLCDRFAAEVADYTLRQDGTGTP